MSYTNGLGAYETLYRIVGADVIEQRALVQADGVILNENGLETHVAPESIGAYLFRTEAEARARAIANTQETIAASVREIDSLVPGFARAMVR